MDVVLVVVGEDVSDDNGDAFTGVDDELVGYLKYCTPPSCG